MCAVACQHKWVRHVTPKHGSTGLAEQREDTVEQQCGLLEMQQRLCGTHAAASLCGYAQHCILQHHQVFHCVVLMPANKTSPL